jgi:uncharacterized lipoprotein YbaY
MEPSNGNTTILENDINNKSLLYHNGLISKERRTTTTPLVKGEISFDKKNIIKSFSGATVYIRLEDVTMQDVPSKLISQQVIKNVCYNYVAGHHKNRIEFALFSDIVVDVRRSYAISVHIDVDNNGNINSGDFINTESYPVITHGYPNDNVLVRVRQVK